MINVTKTYAPPLEKYTKYLEGIWERRWFTNHGPLVVQLEDELKKILGVKHLFFVTNGTIALQIAIKALGLTRKIITSPFSYVATTSSLVWEGCTPLFVDIDPLSFNLSPIGIKSVTDPDVEGIMGVHVYGNPCDVKAIDQEAKKKNWRVIYDAAHAFNVKCEGKSVLEWGDISTLSFHSTKVFHTIEGGAIITNDDELAHKISYMRNFGHQGKEAFWGVGINGKCSEFQAAMGLCMLEEYPKLERMREQKHRYYDEALAEVFETGLIRQPRWHNDTSRNYGYYPILFESEEKLLNAQTALEKEEIFPRRYFYPSLADLPYIKNVHCPIAQDYATRILCIPMYPELEESNQQKIAQILNTSILNK